MPFAWRSAKHAGLPGSPLGSGAAASVHDLKLAGIVVSTLQPAPPCAPSTHGLEKRQPGGVHPACQAAEGPQKLNSQGDISPQADTTCQAMLGESVVLLCHSLI